MLFEVTPLGRSGMSPTIIWKPTRWKARVVSVEVKPEVSDLMTLLVESKICTLKLSVVPGMEGFSMPSIS